jgi:hypothetical protein
MATSALLSPAPQQGGINQMVNPDVGEFQQRKQYLQDGSMVSRSYPGAENDANLVIKAHEILVAERGRHTVGRNSELVFSSVAGLYWGDSINDEALMRRYRKIGVATSDCDVPGGDSLFGTSPLEHGFSCAKAGTETVNYNPSNPAIRAAYAGDIMAIAFPPTYRGGDVTVGNAGNRQLMPLNNGRNTIMSQNTYGTPATKPLVEIVPFDPYDLKPQLALSFHLFERTTGNGGIKGLKVLDFFPDGPQSEKNMSSAQEESMGFYYGLHGVGLNYVYGLLQNPRTREILQAGGDIRAIGDAIGVFDENNEAAIAVLDHIYLRNSPKRAAANARNAPAKDNFGQRDAHNYDYLTDKALDFLTGGIIGAFYAKASRIIGVAMHGAQRGKSFDLMISHTILGF